MKFQEIWHCVCARECVRVKERVSWQNHWNKHIINTHTQKKQLRLRMVIMPFGKMTQSEDVIDNQIKSTKVSLTFWGWRQLIVVKCQNDKSFLFLHYDSVRLKKKRKEETAHPIDSMVLNLQKCSVDNKKKFNFFLKTRINHHNYNNIATAEAEKSTHTHTHRQKSMTFNM